MSEQLERQTQDFAKNAENINYSNWAPFINGLIAVGIVILILLSLFYTFAPAIGFYMLSAILKGNNISCNSGVGFPGMLLLPLIIAMRWELSDFWRKKKQ